MKLVKFNGRQGRLVSLNPGEDYFTVSIDGKDVAVPKAGAQVINLSSSVRSHVSSKVSDFYNKACAWAAAGVNGYTFDKVLSDSGKSHVIGYCNKPACPSRVAVQEAMGKKMKKLPAGTALVFQAKEDPTVKLYICRKCHKFEITKE